MGNYLSVLIEKETKHYQTIRITHWGFSGVHTHNKQHFCLPNCACSDYSYLRGCKIL